MFIVVLIMDLNESLLIPLLPFMYLTILITTVASVGILATGIWKRQRIYLIMGIAFISFLLSMWIFGISEFLLLPHTFLTRYAELIGSSAQAILFSFALSHRINNLRLDKIEAQGEAMANKDLAMRSLEQAARIKDEFLVKTSHELRTPLQGMIALSEYLLHSKDSLTDAERSRSLDLIRLSGKRLSVLVNDLLDY
jgi:signal transduction histidine kinase